MEGEVDNEQNTGLKDWIPYDLLRSFDRFEVRFSRGFLRCSPEKWFPAFAMQWQPLAHSLGVELSLQNVKTFIGGTARSHYAYAGSIDDEPICIFFDDENVATILELIVPKSKGIGCEVVLEYMAMRLLTSLAMSWSGPESSLVRFESDIDPASVREIGGVRLELLVNGMPVNITVMLGKIMLEKMDNLWRKQLQMTSTSLTAMRKIHIELGHLTIPPSMLSDYLRSGVSYDLEMPVSDSVTLINGDKNWISGCLGIVRDRFCVKTLNITNTPVKLPAGTTKLSFEIGTVDLDVGTVAEIAQEGALYDTGIPVSDRVAIVVNNEQVGEGILRSYQGNLVVSVC